MYCLVPLCGWFLPAKLSCISFYTSLQVANVALNKPAYLSSTPSMHIDADASRAVDGFTDTDLRMYSCSKSHENQRSPWWQVDLLVSHAVFGVTITGHGDTSSKSGNSIVCVCLIHIHITCTHVRTHVRTHARTYVRTYL